MWSELKRMVTEPPAKDAHPSVLAMYAAAHPEMLHDGNSHPSNSPPPAPVQMSSTQMSAQMNNRVAERLVNAGVDLTQFKAMTQEDQLTLLQQLAQEEQQAMIQGFDAAKLGFDQSRS